MTVFNMDEQGEIAATGTRASTQEKPLRIDELTLTSGQTVDISDADVVVFVGANNVGKTVSLREIQARVNAIREPHESEVVIKDVAVRANGTQEEFRAWISEKGRITRTQGNPEVLAMPGAGSVELNSILSLWQGLWEGTRHRLDGNGSNFCLPLHCDNRLQPQLNAGRQDPLASPDGPLQWLLSNPESDKVFREAIKEAFGFNVIEDSWGSQVVLRFSKDKTQENFEHGSVAGRIDPEKYKAIAALPELSTQSDGVKSFAGVLISLLGTDFPFVFIDEPEAFLHPPQASRLGRLIADNRKGQVFVSTHSIDVLLGLLHAAGDKVAVVRLSRSNEEFRAKLLPPRQITELWQDPILRFSRALDGLFHDGVVVCEGDTDSLFYRSVFEALPPERKPRLDPMFTFAGSKHRVGVIAAALRSVEVPVAAICDFDLLRSFDSMVSLAKTLSSAEPPTRTEWNVLDAALKSKNAPLTVAAVTQAFLELFASQSGDVILAPAEIDNALKDIKKAPMGWQAAKTAGLSVVPHGPPTASAMAILNKLEELRLFVVHSGEVESFVPDVGGHGSSWVLKVIEDERIDGATAALNFVEKVAASLASTR